MLAVVQEFQVGNEWVPTSMTAIWRGMFLQWLLGPLSDRIGRRPVMPRPGWCVVYRHLSGDAAGANH